MIVNWEYGNNFPHLSLLSGIGQLILDISQMRISRLSEATVKGELWLRFQRAGASVQKGSCLCRSLINMKSKQ